MAIVVTYPSATGIIKAQAQTLTITWTNVGVTGGNVKIELLKGVAVSTIIASTPNDGSYAWAIPAAKTVGTDYKIKVTKLVTVSTDTSNNPFRIVAQNSITTLTPTAGQSKTRGQALGITWYSAGTGAGGTVDIKLYKGVTLKATVVSGTSNDGAYSWTIPAATVPGTDYVVKVNKGAITGVSGTFTIAAVAEAASVTLSIPDATGISWLRGTSHNITWAHVGTSARAVISYKKGAGSWVDIIQNGESPYSWNIPSTLEVGNDYKIKIASCEGVTGTCNTPIVWKSDESTNPFAITGTACSVPVVSFTSSVNGKTVTLNGSATNTPTAWDWGFGDSSTHATTKDVTHTYADNGTFSITLKATNACGDGTKTNDVVISAAESGIDWTLATIFGGLIGVAIIAAYLIGSSNGQQQQPSQTAATAAADRKLLREEEVTRLERQKLAREQFEESQKRMERERIDRLERERLLEQDKIKRIEREQAIEEKRIGNLK